MPSVIHIEDDKSQTVMEYLPKKLHTPVSRAVESFVSIQPEATQAHFRLSELVAQQTGIQELEKASVEKRIEEKALERLQEIQERAYREAYELGTYEGIKRGHEEARTDVSQRLAELNQLVQQFTKIKPDILQRNEGQFMDLIYLLASKIARVEIKKDEQRVLPVLRHAVESLQKDEKMTIKLAPQDLDQVENLKKVAAVDFEFLNAATFEASDSISPGGCIIETNYGLIDATLEERITRLAEVLEDVKPQTKKNEFE